MRSSQLVIPSVVFLAIGIYIGRVFSIAFNFSIPFLVLSLILCLFFFHRRNQKFTAILIFIFIFFTGCILVRYRDVNMSQKRIQIETGKILSIRALVLKRPEKRDFRSLIEMELIRLGDDYSIAKKKIRILVSYEPLKLIRELEPGMIVQFNGIPLAGKKFVSPWQFDYPEYLKIKGISCVLLVTDKRGIRITGRRKINLFYRLVIDARERLKKAILKALPEPESRLLIGIILGKRKELPPDLEEYYRKTGTLHILAASGLHVSIIIAFSLLILFRTGLNKRVAYLLSIPPVLFYALLAGASPSIVRAAVMGVLFLMASALRKDYDPLRSLFLAALFMLIINPYYLFMAGFQLSFTAVAGILILFPVFSSVIPSRGEMQKNLILLYFHDGDSVPGGPIISGADSRILF